MCIFVYFLISFDKRQRRRQRQRQQRFHIHFSFFSLLSVSFKYDNLPMLRSTTILKHTFTLCKSNARQFLFIHLYKNFYSFFFSLSARICDILWNEFSEFIRKTSIDKATNVQSSMIIYGFHSKSRRTNSIVSIFRTEEKL